MTELSEQTCTACQVGAPALTDQDLTEALKFLPEWTVATVDQIPQLKKVYAFPDFVKAQAFANSVGELAETYNHHPAITIEWGRTTVCWWTHKIKGIHQNDAILAAKTDKLYPL